MLAGLIRSARNGVSGSLVIRGEPGIGKTALLRDAVDRASGVTTVELAGFESESAMPFSGLQRLTSPLNAHLPALPERQRLALRVATGAVEGAAPDRFLVGLALLALLAEAGQRRAVLCVIDDAHWLDAETLDLVAFVCRRLRAEPVAVLLAMRDVADLEPRVAGIDTLRLEGLELDAAVALLGGSLPAAVDPLVAAQVARATGGNPLALIDLADELSIRQLTESGLAQEPIPVGHHLQAHYVRRVRQLPTGVQDWLVLVAADSTGRTDLLTRARELLGVHEMVGDAAERSGLVEIGSSIAFRHPLVRAAVYNSASGAERRHAHDALSAAAADLHLVELEAWHAAKARIGTDPAVADRLDRVADSAGRRGGFASRASVLTRAAELTPAGPRRNDRLIGAAEASLIAGAAQVAAQLIDRLDDRELDPVQRCRAVAARVAAAMFTGDSRELVWGTARLLDAASGVHGAAPELEQTALVQAFQHCLPSERLTRGVTLVELGERLRAGAGLTEGTAAVVLRGLAALIQLPYHDAVPVMRAAVDAIQHLRDEQEVLRLGTISVALTSALWDHRARAACLEQVADAARDTGSLQLLDTVLWIRSLAELTGGTPRRAGEYVEQVRELRRAIGWPSEHVVNAAYLAWAGDPPEQVEALAEAMRSAGFGGVHSSAVTALALRDLAEGHYREAFNRLRPFVDDPFLHVTPLVYPEMVEAGVRGGRPVAEVVPLVEVLEGMAESNGSVWARGVAARSRALVAPEAEAEAHQLAAVEHLTAAGLVVELGRARLLYGEWLRRRKRRREARIQLQAAMELLTDSGAVAFAGRARAELRATGQLVTDQPRRPLELTPQEGNVARLAAQGRTNLEISSTLFLSVNTVDYHLRKVFQKLGITSRRQLTDRTGGSVSQVEP